MYEYIIVIIIALITLFFLKNIIHIFLLFLLTGGILITIYLMKQKYSNDNTQKRIRKNLLKN